LNSVY